MTFKSTAALFGLLLGMLWLFGMMLAFKKTHADESFILPNLQAVGEDYDIDKVSIRRLGSDKKSEEIEFTKKDGLWIAQQAGLKQAIRVDEFQINKIVKEVTAARRSDDASPEQNLSEFGLDSPRITVTLTGHKPKTDKEKSWQLFVGNESADKVFAFVNSSERPGRVFPVLKSGLASVFFTNVNSLRTRQIFKFLEPSISGIRLTKGKSELELKQDEKGLWRFEKPSLGFADYEGPQAPKKDPTKPFGEKPFGEKAPEGGVKSLLLALLSMRIETEEDFVLSTDLNPAHFGLEAGQEKGRIEFTKFPDKDAQEKKKVEATKEVLLLGNPVEGKNYIFARLADDPGIFKLNVKLLAPFDKALADPEKDSGNLRSTDIAIFDVKKVDALVLKYGKEETAFWLPDGKTMMMKTGSEKPIKASEKSVTALLDSILGKREIQKFYDDPDGKKIDAELGFDDPASTVSVYVNGLIREDPDAKENEKEPKDKKEKKEKKKDDGPEFKKDMKPAVLLIFGKTDKELVNVKRVLPDGTISRFAVPKTLLEKVSPAEGTLAFLDTALPNYGNEEIISLKLERGPEKFELVKGSGDQSNRWFFKEAASAGSASTADVDKTKMFVHLLSGLQAKKWLRKISQGDDLEKYGLKTPAIVATLRIKKDRLQPEAAATVSAMLGGPFPMTGILAGSLAVASRQSDPGEAIVVKIGKETDEAKDKPGYFAQHSGATSLFLLAPDFVKFLRETDFTDRDGILRAEAFLAIRLVGFAAAEPQAAWLFASPLATGQILGFDPAKVKEVEIVHRNPFELRTFAFERKDKTWQVKSGLSDFSLDTEKLSAFLKDLGELKTDRFVSLDGQKPEHKLGAKEFQLKINLAIEGGQTATLTIGAPFERQGFFAQLSSWPDAVFFVPASKFDTLLNRGAGHFAKERVAGAQ